MGGFNKFGGGRGGKSFGGGRKFGGKGFGGGKSFGGRGGDRQMFSATCDQCGKSCEVPFRPTGERDVLCSDCFKSQRGGSFDRPQKSFGRDREFKKEFKHGAAPSAGAGITKGQVDFIISKLDKILSLLSEQKVASVKVEPEKIAPEVKVEKKEEKKSAEKKVKASVKKEKKSDKKSKSKKK